jgi:hypothetical protein
MTALEDVACFLGAAVFWLNGQHIGHKRAMQKWRESLEPKLKSQNESLMVWIKQATAQGYRSYIEDPPLGYPIELIRPEWDTPYVEEDLRSACANRAMNAIDLYWRPK